jgi:CheY-like chemotaxis protein
MGERILREEGFEVVTVTNGETALMRLSDVDPDVVFADVSLPGRSGYDICREIKSRPRHRHVRVILTAGLLEHFDDAAAISSRCDAVIKKPFEASMVLETVRPLVESAMQDRAAMPDAADLEPRPTRVVPVRVVSDYTGQVAERVAKLDDPEAERVRAAVTIALDAAMPDMIDKITEQVLVALGH